MTRVGITVDTAGHWQRYSYVTAYGIPTPPPAIEGPPFRRLVQWIDWRRAQRVMRDQESAVVAADTVVAITEQKLDVRLDRVFEAERFDARMQEFLTVGLACAGSGALIGAAIGSIIPGVGTLIGAVAGAIVGVIVGAFAASFNFARFDLFGQTKQYFDTLTVEERYMHFQMFRTLSDRARERDGEQPFPAWRMDFRTGWDEFRAGNADIVYSLFKLLWERDSVPNDPAIIPWALACATVESQSPDEKLRDQWAYQKVVNDGAGSPWLKEVFQGYADARCGDLQTGSGLPDYTAIPITEGVKNALLALPYYN